MMYKQTVAMAAVALLTAAQAASAHPTYVSRIPNGSVNSCNNCHPGGDTSYFTPFANAFAVTHTWSASLAKQDSDGDGFTNGQELGDPQGVWVSGAPLPIANAQVSLPGDATSMPTLTPPPISISSPTNGSALTAPYAGPITAASTDAAAAISKIQFYSGSTLLGTVTNAPYSLAVNLPAGSYSITAKITDYLGATNTSAAAQITVNSGTPPVIEFQPVPSLTNGVITLTASGFSGHGTIVFYSSANLTNWTAIGTNPPATGSVVFTNSVSTNTSVQFYKALEN